MKKICFKFLFCLALIVIFFIPSKVFSYNDYTITDYDVNMVINENNTFDITETLTVDFDVSRHEIHRKIPLKNLVTSSDGSISYNNAKVRDVTVNTNYSTYIQNDYMIIEIGNTDLTVSGSQTYKIKYTYEIEKNSLKATDQLYLNLIGNEFNTIIDNVTFSITMPNSFDASMFELSNSYTDFSNDSNIIYTANTNAINGYVINSLSEEETLSLRLSLPEKYLSSSIIDEFSFFVILASLGFVFIANKLWVKYKKENVIDKTIEFYPPEGFNPTDLGYLYNGYIDDKSVVSLLPYLANKGYIQIEEAEQNGMFSSSTRFKIVKNNSYHESDENEQIFINGLFPGDKKTVTPSDLYGTFYKYLHRIKFNFNSKEIKSQIFESFVNTKIRWIILMILAIFVLITFKPVMQFTGFGTLMLALVLPIIGFSVLLGLISWKNTQPLKILGITCAIIFSAIPLFTIVLPALVQNSTYFITYVIGLICISSLAWFIKKMPKRTVFGNEILGRITGFKTFLETAEEEQLENLVEENPEFFYNTIPYAYALGVLDVWMEKFDSIEVKKPTWYYPQSTFSVNTFRKFMSDAMNSVNIAMTSVPSDHSMDIDDSSKDNNDDESSENKNPW